VFVSVLASIPILIWGVAWAATGSGTVAVLAGLVAFPLALAILLGYYPFTMKGSGQTPGKRLVGIRVVRDDGQEVTLGWAALREIVVKGLLIGGVGGSLFIPWLLNYIWPLVDDQNRAFHDMLVKSHVTRS
jgi:uncharacterized RDD family membrane protein YckC